MAGKHGDQTEDDQQPDHRGDAAMQQLDRGQTIEAETESAAAQRPGITAPTGAAADDERATDDQQVGPACRDEGPAHGDPIYAACQLWRQGRNGGDTDRAQQRHGGRQVRQHDHGRQLEADGDRTQHDLHHQQAQGDRCRDHEVTALAPGQPGKRRGQHNQHTRQRCRRAVRVFDDGVQVERRQQPAMTERPVGAAQPGSRDPDHAAQDHQRVGHHRGGDAQHAEGFHAIARGQCSAPAVTPRRRSRSGRPLRTGGTLSKL